MWAASKDASSLKSSAASRVRAPDARRAATQTDRSIAAGSTQPSL